MENLGDVGSLCAYFNALHWFGFLEEIMPFFLLLGTLYSCRRPTHEMNHMQLAIPLGPWTSARLIWFFIHWFTQ